MKRINKQNKPWSDEEERLLLTMKDEGFTESEIGSALGRSRGSIVWRLRQLGFYRDEHSYKPMALPGRPVALDVDEAMRAAYRMLGMRDLEYNRSGERAMPSGETVEELADSGES